MDLNSDDLTRESTGGCGCGCADDQKAKEKDSREAGCQCGDHRVPHSAVQEQPVVAAGGCGCGCG